MDILTEKAKKGQRAKRSKKPDNRPARARYWSSHKLEHHKVRNLVRHNGMTEHEARLFWREVRTKRIKKLWKNSNQARGLPLAVTDPQE